jgi:hypothetical protein
MGKSVDIKGFMIPMDFTAKQVKEFLLVPYVPSCQHVPPPPPNQIIMVKLKKGMKMSYFPIKVSGKIQLKNTNNPMMQSTYEMAATKVQELK